MLLDWIARHRQRTHGQARSSRRLETLSGPTMGTRYTARFVAKAGLDLVQLSAALQRAVDAVDAQMSTWKPQSDLRCFNRAMPGQWVDIPADLTHVVALGLQVSALSAGAFDMTMSPLVDLWGFGPPGPRTSAPDAILTQTLLRAATGSQHLQLDLAANRLRKDIDLALDLSGIAKGFGVDRMTECLKTHGIDDFIADIDGELRAQGVRLDGTPWRVGVELPIHTLRLTHSVVLPKGRAMATSGDYRRFFEVGGERFAHTIDPRTGRPVANRLGSVTVLADTCTMADAWATALLVLGEEDGVALARRQNLDALFLVRTHDDFAAITTGSFALHQP